MYTHTEMLTCTNDHTHIRAHTHTHAHICPCSHTHTHAFTYSHTYNHIHSLMSTQTHLLTHMLSYKHTCTQHTHTQTLTHFDENAEKQRSQELSLPQDPGPTATGQGGHLPPYGTHLSASLTLPKRSELSVYFSHSLCSPLHHLPFSMSFSAQVSVHSVSVSSVCGQ